jgi:uncharacterized protein (TIGR00369 family)
MSPAKFGMLRRLFEEQIPFNRLLGVRVISAQDGKASLGFDFRPELVGNFKMGILHGGVIASVLDLAGGAAVIAAYGDDESLHGMGTVDLRTDYLRPGSGKHFVASAEVVRHGRILSATRMELRNDQDALIATGSAVYRTSAKDEYVLMNL